MNPLICKVVEEGGKQTMKHVLNLLSIATPVILKYLAENYDDIFGKKSEETC